MLPLHCCSKVSLDSSSIQDLGACWQTVGTFSRQGGRDKKRKITERFFFSFEAGARAVHTRTLCVCHFAGKLLTHHVGSHSSTGTSRGCGASGLLGFLKFPSSCRGEPPTPVGKVTWHPHRCGIAASYKMWKLESVNVTCSLFANSGAARFQDHGWVRIWWQDPIRQGGWKLVLLLLSSSMGADPGPWAPGTLETPWQQVLAHANAWVCPRGQVLFSLEQWPQLGSHAAPLPSSVSEFYRPPVIGTAPPSNSSGSLVGQLVLLLPGLWLLFWGSYKLLMR